LKKIRLKKGSRVDAKSTIGARKYKIKQPTTPFSTIRYYINRFHGNLGKVEFSEKKLPRLKRDQKGVTNSGGKNLIGAKNTSNERMLKKRGRKRSDG